MDQGSNEQDQQRLLFGHWPLVIGYSDPMPLRWLKTDSSLRRPPRLTPAGNSKPDQPPFQGALEATWPKPHARKENPPGSPPPAVPMPGHDPGPTQSASPRKHASPTRTSTAVSNRAICRRTSQSSQSKTTGKLPRQPTTPSANATVPHPTKLAIPLGIFTRHYAWNYPKLARRIHHGTQQGGPSRTATIFQDRNRRLRDAYKDSIRTITN